MRRAFLLAATALALTGCGSGGGELIADSSCEDYVNASRDEQVAAVQKTAQSQQVPYSALVQNNVDAKCSVRPKQSIAFAVAGPGHGTNDVTHEPAATSEPLTLDSTCQEYLDAPPDEQQAFIHKLADRFDRETDYPNYDSWQEYAGTVCSGVPDVTDHEFREVVMGTMPAVDPGKWDRKLQRPKTR